ncbi:MAG TPA: aminotransferase class I/II-fold pyridoxal phosphate-dependent enzyme [Leptolyngbyaceae cyanobacterium M65_K2018_010]|nr:aminotransferase class I/II-fold pyridoxal phosphate-dependent enzyme [Leptolyngbyaceae cyanobacterium M65_K2018_010]
MMDQTQTPILSALQESGQRSMAAFFAPGHKRGQGASPRLKQVLGTAALRSDLPELPELDNLFAPEGIIRAAQELAAAAFGAEQTWFLANGSTCGLEAAILATCNPGDKILVPRNVHRSVISGLVLAGARPVYVLPEYAPDLGLVLGVQAEAIAAALAHHPDIRAVLLVSPTYHGICSQVAAIAAIAHAHGIPLLVDEAHGAHLAFHPQLPASALAQGADLVVQSTHKVLSALSQAAMIHSQGDRIDRDRLRAALALVQSSSPNYLLLASLDAARHQIATAGESHLSDTLALALALRAQLSAIPGLSVVDLPALAAYSSVQDLDLTRISVDVSDLGLTGLAADAILHEELGVTVELPELRHLTLIVSLGNTSADGWRCLEGFRTLAERFPIQKNPSMAPAATPQMEYAEAPLSLPLVSPREAFFAPKETVRTAAAPGRISAETLSAYPPGIPTLVAGEVITPEAIAYLRTVKHQGGYVTGASDPALETLQVLSREPLRAFLG